MGVAELRFGLRLPTMATTATQRGGTSMSSTRSRDREVIGTTASLVEFLRDVALARRRRTVDVGEYETVLWLDDLPAEVNVDTSAGPGEPLFAVPRLRVEAPPE